MCSRFTGATALEQRLSHTAAPEMIGYGSRLVERKVMKICQDEG